MTNIPTDIREAIRNNRLILWVGAGFSQRRLELPSWRGLVEELVGACLPADEAADIKSRLENGLISEIQALEALKACAEKCHQFLHDRFNLNLDRDSRVDDFELLWHISPKIITTNYDTGLDMTKPTAVPKVVYNKKFQRKSLVAGEKFYFKLHGCASEPEHCILFQDQYDALYRDTSQAQLDALSDEDTPAKFLLKHLLTDHTVLFIGFGMEDRVDFVLEYIHRLLGNTAFPKYALVRHGHAADWPHTQKWAISDWDELPGVLRLLAEEKARHQRPPVLGDTTMPFDRPYVGRDADVDAVEKFFRGSGNFFYLHGAGGMGKSHLLDAVLRRLPPELQPVYLRIERHYTVLTITEKLGIPPVPPVPPPKTSGEPYPPNQHLLEAFGRLGRPLVFDDFYEISDPALFYTLLELAKRRDTKALLISRSLPPDWARFDANVPHRELRELEQPDFEECLRGLAAEMSDFEGRTPTPEQLDTCWNLCGGYPLGGLLLLGLLAGGDFDPAHLERLDLAADPTRSHFVDRLLKAILEKGTDAERNLAREIAVYAEPVPEAALAQLPAWKPDRVAFFALWRRKGLVFCRQNDKRYGMHALVRSLLLQQLGAPPEARACAGRYYESLSGLTEVERVVALQKALEHYDLSPEETRNAFRARMQRAFVAISVKQLRDEQDPALAIERFRFRQQLNPADAAAANELGMAYRRQGNLEKAIEVLEWAAGQGNIHSSNELGIALRKAGRIDKAIEVLQKAAEAGHIYSMNELGITFRETGRLEEATQILEKAVELEPDNVIVLNQLGIVLREAGRTDQAVQVLQKAVGLGHVHSMNELGITLREAGKLEKAIQVLQEAADLANVHSMNELGIALREAGKLDEAIQVFQKAAELNNFQSFNELGITLRATGKFKEAIQVLRKAANQGNLHALNELGITLRGVGKLEDAIQVLQKAADQGNLHALNELGITLREAGKLAEAIQILEKAVELQPDNVILLNGFGAALRESGKVEDALQILQKAVGLQPDNVILLNELSITLRKTGKLNEAIRVLERAIGLQPDNVILLNGYGAALRESGKVEDALLVLRKATDLGNIPSFNELGIALREAGKLNEAIHVLQIAADQGQIPAMNELGITFREVGRLDEAIHMLQKAVDLGNIQSFNELGISLRKAGKLDEAIHVLQIAADQGQVPAMNELGITLREIGRLKDAIHMFQMAADLGNAPSFNELGITLRAVGELDKAIQVLQIAADQGHAYAMNELGITLREAGKLDEAIKVLQKAADIGQVYSMNELGISLRSAGKLDDAIRVLQIAADQGHAYAMNELGITFRAAGKLDEAIQVLQKAAELGHVHSMNELGITLREAGKLDEAIQVLQKATELGHVHSMNELGITLREAGKLDDAIQVLQKAAVLQPENVILINELGITLRKAGQYEQAIPYFEKASKAGNYQSTTELTIALREIGRIDAAIEVVKKGMEKRPRDGFFKRILLHIYLFFQPDQSTALVLLKDPHLRLEGVPAQIYPQIAEQLDALLKYQITDIALYRQYIQQIFRHHAFHFAIEYLTGLIQKYPRAEFKARLGEALCQPAIGRYAEGIKWLREALEELEQKPALHPYYLQTALLLLEAYHAKGGAKEFRKTYARLEPILRNYPPFEEKRAAWERETG